MSDLYKFKGWSSENNNIPEDDILFDIQFNKDAYACYGPNPVQYWLNVDGTELWISHFDIGEVPIYGGITPINPVNNSWNFKNTWTNLSSTVQNTMEIYYAQYNVPTGWEETMPYDWDEIIAMHDDGNYGKLPIGKTKLLNVGEYGWLCMILVGKDTTLGAKTDWITKTLLKNNRQYDSSGKVGDKGWGSNPELRQFLNNELYDSIQLNVRSRIVETTQYSSFAFLTYNVAITKDIETIDKVWIPNSRETNQQGNNTAYVSKGPVYSTAFPNNWGAASFYDQDGILKPCFLREVEHRASTGKYTTFNTYGAGLSELLYLDSFYGIIPSFCIN